MLPETCLLSVESLNVIAGDRLLSSELLPCRESWKTKCLCLSKAALNLSTPSSGLAVINFRLTTADAICSCVRNSLFSASNRWSARLKRTSEALFLLSGALCLIETYSRRSSISSFWPWITLLCSELSRKAWASYQSNSLILLSLV